MERVKVVGIISFYKRKFHFVSSYFLSLPPRSLTCFLLFSHLLFDIWDRNGCTAQKWQSAQELLSAFERLLFVVVHSFFLTLQLYI
jgi:hypothetical protein